MQNILNQYQQKLSRLKKKLKRKKKLKKNIKRKKKKEDLKFTPKEYTECLLQIRLFDGSTTKQSFKAESTLEDVALFIIQSSHTTVNYGDFSIVTPFPKKEYFSTEFNQISLKDAQLLPKGSITIQKLESKGVIKKGEGIVQPEDPDSGDEPNILPFNPMNPLGPSKPKPVLPVIEPIEEDDDQYKQNIKLLCKLWLLSNEECPEGSEILVYRPSDFQFTQVKTDRKAFVFTDDGTYSEIQVIEGVKNTVSGTWSLKKNGTDLTIKIGSSSKKVEIATITDEVLILS